MRYITKTQRRERITAALAAALAIILLDQATKALVMAWVATHTSLFVTPFLNIVLAWNYGISFGIGNDALQDQVLIILLAIGIIALLVMFLLHEKTQDFYVPYAIGTIIGGAIGNIIDRIHYGAVVDFIDLHIYQHHWPAFNIADSAIALGAAIWILWPVRK